MLFKPICAAVAFAILLVGFPPAMARESQAEIDFCPDLLSRIDSVAWDRLLSVIDTEIMAPHRTPAMTATAQAALAHIEAAWFADTGAIVAGLTEGGASSTVVRATLNIWEDCARSEYLAYRGILDIERDRTGAIAEFRESRDLTRRAMHGG